MSKGVKIASTTLGYDKLNRLINSSDEPAFVLDALGNQLQRNGQFNDLNQLLEDNDFIYTYSLNGNLLTRLNKKNNELTTFSWDSENKITQIQVTKNQQTIKTILYKFDALGRRIYRSVQTQNYSYVRKYVYDGNNILMELNQDDVPVAVYLHGPGIDNPIAILRDHDGDGEFSESEIYIFTKDHLNSVRDLTNMNQKLIQRYNYSAYGKVKLERIADASDVRFVENYFTYTAREWEPEIGIICNRNRCHDGNGRWVSEDPKNLRSGNNNLYEYVSSNSIRYRDPLGASEQDVTQAIKYVTSNTNLESATFGFGTPNGSTGFAIPFANHILLSEKYKGNLTDSTKRQLLQTVHHELTHVTQGTFKALTLTEEEHIQIHLDSYLYSLRNNKNFLETQGGNSCPAK